MVGACQHQLEQLFERKLTVAVGIELDETPFAAAGEFFERVLSVAIGISPAQSPQTLFAVTASRSIAVAVSASVAAASIAIFTTAPAMAERRRECENGQGGEETGSNTQTSFRHSCSFLMSTVDFGVSP